MDDLLKSYAKKRRDEAGAPLALHPATRRLLHGEVARLRSESPRQSRRWFSPLLALWPQLTAAASILVVFAVGYRVLLQDQELSPEVSQYAKQQAREPELESLDRLNNQAPEVGLPAAAESSQDKKNEAFRFLSEVQTTPAPREDRTSAARPFLAKAKDYRTDAPGARENPFEVRQSVAAAAEEKAVPVNGSGLLAERDALTRMPSLLPQAPPPAQEPMPVLRQLTLSDSDSLRVPAVQAQADAFNVTLADKEIAKSAQKLTLTNLSARSDSLLDSPLAVGNLTLQSYAGRDGSGVSIQSGLAGVVPEGRPTAYGFDSGLTKNETTLAGATAGSVPVASATSQAASPSLQGQRYYRLATVSERRESEIERGQRFKRAALPASDSKDTANNAYGGVLASFVLQQIGGRLRAIDADGSTYEGQVGDMSESIMGKEAPEVAPALQPARALTKLVRPGTRFRLVGTNQTLKQLVVFEGMLSGEPATAMPPEQTAPAGPATQTTTRGVSANRFAAPASTLPAGPIQGTLRVGNSNAVPIQAIPVTR